MRLALLLCLLTPAEAQWTSLATNQDASQIYFVSTLQQTGTSQPAWGKLFIVDSAGLRPLVIWNRTFVLQESPNAYLTNFYNIIGVDVAADVSRIAVVASDICTVSSGVCVYFSAPTTSTTVFDTTGIGTSFSGLGRLSPNGQWLSLFVDQVFSPFPASVSNLATNSTSTFQLPAETIDYKNGSIANNGTFAFGGFSAGLTILPTGGTLTTIPNRSTSARLDAAGDTLVWTQTANNLESIMVANTSTLTPRVLFSSTANAYDPSISSDGTKALFLTSDASGNPQAFLIDINGTALVQVTHETSGVIDALLSPDGQAVVAVADDGSLFRFHLITGERDQLIGPTLSVTPQPLAYHDSPPPSPQGSPGQIVHLTGTHLDSATIQVNGLNAPVIATTPTSIDFQVPWETPAAGVVGYSSGPGVPFTVSPASATSGWQGGAQGNLNVLVSNPSWIVAIHQNFQGLITVASPAHPGEIINIYATGLGPVANPPADGQPARNSPLSPLITPLKVNMMNASISPTQTINPAVLFAGLAPGTIGYYQISVQLPSSLATGNFALEAVGTSGYITIPVAQ